MRLKKKVSFQLLVKMRRVIAENGLERNENENKDGVVEHSKEKEP